MTQSLLFFVFCPIRWRTLPDCIFQIQFCASLNEEAHYVLMPGQGGLMQWGRMGMKSNWVVSTWIFASIKQRSNDLSMTKLRRQG
jgi:hypothetical protein